MKTFKVAMTERGVPDRTSKPPFETISTLQEDGREWNIFFSN
ncbi:hypothetical protein U0C82_12445 [Fulvimarina sp. 2208YS6-2-32]|uniref:Uncharacterized protein n=1 Tax=Fulvimarina uroteuthidis TaxID=3098149 RepID=A0ABU5I3L7_9HYPH|nr:hypothetical protein [Fulvimarina sp. 2208YS6-2-32]MDY8109948.1 hypothetical protein [Fulvimarina sp. 2208YS6-2-32]